MCTHGFGTGKWVFVDWMGVDPGFGAAWGGGGAPHGVCVPQGIELQVHRPRVHSEYVIAPDQPWEKNGIAPYASFLVHEGRFHCWYETTWLPSSIPVENGLAYAASDDGVEWTKPVLAAREALGSRQNNLTDLSAHGTCVFVDCGAEPNERFKTACQYNVPPAPGQQTPRWWRQVGGAVSGDGVHWHALPGPILRSNHADTQNVAAFAADRGRYVLYTRQRDGRMMRRGVNRSESADFRAFPPATPVLESDPCDPPDWDIYCSGYHVWPGANCAQLMFMSLYRHTADSMCVHLATSRDGVQWHRPLGRESWIDAEDIHLDPEVVQVYACHGILPTSPQEWSFYLSPAHEGHNAPKTPTGILRATCRPDGFVSLRAEGTGAFWTVPFRLGADRITLNMKSQYAGWLRCGLLRRAHGETGHATTPGDPVPGYTLEDCAVLDGDHVATELRWRGGEIARLKGETIRLVFQMYKVDLYAICFHGT